MNRRAQARPFMGMHLPHSTLMKATVAAGDKKPATQCKKGTGGALFDCRLP